ncbi:hypothetical protein WA026_021771 [Henosepilachna vigintioctopunctata]|uniref:Uncharacterized protein n=1 Tax=Henosepilachna vigintioctopunctata TaxID=420089 RepID=A0AAW1TP50_9CUCU
MDFVEARLLDDEPKIKSKNKTTKQNDIAFKSNHYICYKYGQAKLQNAQPIEVEFRGLEMDLATSVAKSSLDRSPHVRKNDTSVQRNKTASSSVPALVSQKNCTKMSSKKEFCIFCKSCMEKKKIETLRKQGQFEYNSQPERNIDNKFLSMRRPIQGLTKKRDDYFPCPKCHGYYSKTARRQHSVKCDPSLKKTRTSNYF